MVQEKFKADLKRLVNSPWLGNLQKQWNTYENRLMKLVKEFDEKSRDARDKSRQRLDQFTDHLKKTRGEVEKKVTSILNDESKRINKRVNELLTYLKKSMATSEKMARKATVGTKKKTTKTTKAKTTSSKKTARARRAPSTKSKSRHSSSDVTSMSKGSSHSSSAVN